MTKYLVYAAILQIVWGLVPSASNYVIQEIPVELYIAIRWTISGLIFAGFVLAVKSWRHVSLKDVAAVSALGILGYGVASFGTLYGLKVGGVTNFALMSALGPVMTSVVSILMLGERPARLFWLALPMAVLGLLLLVIGKYQVSSFEIAGTAAVFILGGALLESLVFVFSRKFKSRMSTSQYLAVAQISTAMVMWLVQGLWLRQVAEMDGLTIRGFGAAMFVSVVACVLCYAVLYWLLNHVAGHKLALFETFHALSAAVFGYVLFAETLTPMMLVGGVFILAGVTCGNLNLKTR